MINVKLKTVASIKIILACTIVFFSFSSVVLAKKNYSCSTGSANGTGTKSTYVLLKGTKHSPYYYCDYTYLLPVGITQEFRGTCEGTDYRIWEKRSNTSAAITCTYDANFNLAGGYQSKSCMNWGSKDHNVYLRLKCCNGKNSYKC